jgi:hypothetical protein
MRRWFLALTVSAYGAALAASDNNAMTQSVPTLDEFGMIALVAVLCGVAGWLVSRRGK